LGLLSRYCITWTTPPALTAFSLFIQLLNNAAVNMGVKISLQDLVYTYFRYMPSSEIVGSYDKSIFNFWELSILLSIAAALYYNPINKQCIRVLISPYLHQHWYILGFFFEFLILIFEFFLYCAGWGYIVFLNLHTLLWGASLW
jgi:hypothetical protein